MTTSRALIADGRRAPRGRVEKSVTAMDGQRTAGAGSCLTQRARPEHRMSFRDTTGLAKKGRSEATRPRDVTRFHPIPYGSVVMVNRISDLLLGLSVVIPNTE